MVVTIAPSSGQFDETVNTLKYASRAKNIKTNAIENKKMVEFHISEYRSIINDLKNEVESLKIKLKHPNKTAEDEAPCTYCRSQLREDEEEMRKIEQ